MSVQIVNQRILTASAGVAALSVDELRRLIGGLAGDQKIDLAVTPGYSDPRESSPASIKLTINDPRPDGPIMRGAAWQGDIPSVPR